MFDGSPARRGPGQEVVEHALSLAHTRPIRRRKPSSDFKIECIFNTRVTSAYVNDVI